MQRKTNTYGFTYTRNLKTNKEKQTHSNRDQRHGYQKGGEGEYSQRGKRNIVNNIVIRLQGNR